MKRRTITLLTCMALACACVALAGCQGQLPFQLPFQQGYTPQTKAPTVSSTALGEAGVLRVGVNPEVGPLAGRDTEGNYVGMDVDAAAYLADQLGCKVQIVDVGTDVSGALKDGKVDVVLGVDSSDSETDFWRSTPYFSTGVALFGSSSESAVPTPDSAPKVAAQGSSKSAWRVTNLFGDESLVAKDDLKTAFAELGSGSSRYVAADAIAGTYVSYVDNDDAKVVALLQDPSGYCAAVAQSNSELQGALSLAVDQLVNGGMADIIESKWLGKPLDLGSVTVVKTQVSEEEEKSSEDESEESSEEGSEEGGEEAAPAEGEGGGEEAA